MSDIPTISQLRDSAENDSGQTLLRQTIMLALKDGPWRHVWLRTTSSDAEWECMKCGNQAVGARFCSELPQDGCEVPDKAEGSLADLAYRLVQAVRDKHGSEAALHIAKGMDQYDQGYDWVNMEPIDHILCCLLALGKARKGDE